MIKDRYGYGVSNEAFKELSSEMDIVKYLESKAFNEWTKSPWNSKKDINHISSIVRSIAESYRDSKPWYVPKSSWNEKYVENVKKILSISSQKKGAPSQEEIYTKLQK